MCIRLRLHLWQAPLRGGKGHPKAYVTAIKTYADECMRFATLLHQQGKSEFAFLPTVYARGAYELSGNWKGQQSAVKLQQALKCYPRRGFDHRWLFGGPAVLQDAWGRDVHAANVLRIP